MGAFVLLRLFTPQPSMVSRATLLTSTGDWVQSYGGYFWRDDKNALAFRAIQGGLQAVNVEVSSGKETTLDALTASLKKAGTTDVGNWRLTSDGKLLLWRSRVVSERESLWSITDLSGKNLRTWKCPVWNSSPLWMAQKGEWLELRTGGATTPVVHSLNGKDSKLSRIGAFLNFAFAVSPDNKLICMNQPDRSGNFSWEERPLSPKPLDMTLRTLSLPKGCDSIQEAEMSPDGENIAILFNSSSSTALENIMQRFLPNSRFANRPHLQLWVFSRDGNQRRFLGTENENSVSGILWTLDSKSVSFMTNGKLYRVPLEK